MNNKKKVIITIIITVLIGLLTIAGSFALWTTIVGNNINVDFNTVVLSDYIEYTAGKAVFSGNIEATNAYPEGVEGTYTTFKINKKNNPAYPFYAGLKLQITNISEILTQSRVLKWTVTSKASGTNDSEVVVAESDFVGTSMNDTIILVPNILVTDTSTDYNVYIWVDSNNSNASQVEGESIEVELWMDVYQYRAPKVLDAFCYEDGTNVLCNVLDSEKSFNRYGLNTTNAEPVSYTSISSGEYWTEIDTTKTNEIIAFFKTFDDRIIKIKTNGAKYQQVEYIEGTGTQYIDTNLDLFSTDNHRIVIELMPTSFYNYNTIWGSSYDANTFESWIPSTGNMVARYNNVKYGPDNKLTVNTKYIFDFRKENTSLSKYVDNNLIGTGTSSSKITNASFYLFLSGTDYGKYKLYSCQLYRDNILVRDFIPVYRVNDDEAGLYDVVNDVFYTNANASGDNFTAGPEV